MDPFENKRWRLKLAFVVQAIVLLAALLGLAHWDKSQNVGITQLNPMQIIYVFLSIEIVAAVYLWGVGNWSRFEPPRVPAGPATPIAGGSVQAQTSESPSPAAGQGNVSPTGQNGSG
ncbi:MAG TPA: hypothetical protein VNH19_01195 [Candidatus Limnocylindrales bacterium]|nr:hypothetical protein [Candidatus Limnocylindrales bacterium]